MQQGSRVSLSSPLLQLWSFKDARLLYLLTTWLLSIVVYKQVLVNMRDFVSIEVHDLVWVKSCFISLCTLPHHQAWTQKKKNQIMGELRKNEVPLLRQIEFLYFPIPKIKPWPVISLMCLGQRQTFIANSVWTTVVLPLAHSHHQTLVQTLRDLRNFSNKWLLTSAPDVCWPTLVLSFTHPHH